MILQRAARKYLRTGAPWMLQRWASTFFEAIGAVLDTEAQRVLDGRLAANPYAGADPNAAKLATGQRIECQPDALPWHRADRGLFSYPSMSVLGQRIQCSQWHQLHARRGTPQGEMRHAAPLFVPGGAPVFRIVHQDGSGTYATWHKLDAAGVYSKQRITPSNFNYDGQTAKWSRWGVFVEMDGTSFTAPNKYDDGHTYDDGAVYDAGGANPFTGANAADLVNTFLDWQSAHSHLMFVALVWGGTVDPTATPTQDATGWWSLPNGKWGTTVDATTGLGTRPPNYIWLYDSPG